MRFQTHSVNKDVTGTYDYRLSVFLLKVENQMQIFVCWVVERVRCQNEDRLFSVRKGESDVTLDDCECYRRQSGVTESSNRMGASDVTNSYSLEKQVWV